MSGTCKCISFVLHVDQDISDDFKLTVTLSQIQILLNEFHQIFENKQRELILFCDQYLSKWWKNLLESLLIMSRNCRTVTSESGRLGA